MRQGIFKDNVTGGDIRVKGHGRWGQNELYGVQTLRLHICNMYRVAKKVSHYQMIKKSY